MAANIKKKINKIVIFMFENAHNANLNNCQCASELNANIICNETKHEKDILKYSDNVQPKLEKFKNLKLLHFNFVINF